jgi:hypothetical protein
MPTKTDKLYWNYAHRRHTYYNGFKRLGFIGLPPSPRYRGDTPCTYTAWLEGAGQYEVGLLFAKLKDAKEWLEERVEEREPCAQACTKES